MDGCMVLFSHSYDSRPETAASKHEDREPEWWDPMLEVKSVQCQVQPTSPDAGCMGQKENEDSLQICASAPLPPESVPASPPVSRPVSPIVCGSLPVGGHHQWLHRRGLVTIPSPAVSQPVRHRCMRVRPPPTIDGLPRAIRALFTVDCPPPPVKALDLDP
jgi:hypothetical protein